MKAVPAVGQFGLVGEPAPPKPNWFDPCFNHIIRAAVLRCNAARAGLIPIDALSASKHIGGEAIQMPVLVVASPIPGARSSRMNVEIARGAGER